LGFPCFKPSRSIHALSREWFFLLSHELFSPKRGLFEFSSDQTYLLQISSGNPQSKSPAENGAANHGKGNGAAWFCMAGIWVSLDDFFWGIWVLLS
jgi:hypothetical protein